MLKGSITFALVLLLTTSIFSQVDAKGGSFKGGIGGFGGAKSFSSNSMPLGTGQGKMFTSSPSGKISPQESAQGPKQTGSSSTIKSDLERNRQSQSQQQQQPNSQFQQQQPRSNFFGGGFGGGLGGFGNMLMASIMGNFIGQALFGWMLPHPVPVVSSPATTSSQQMVAPNNSSNNNSTIKK